jgi:chromosome segregation ATPase
MEERVGLLHALWRLVSFWKLRKALGLVRAANRQFTGSVGGISDAYDIQHDSLVRQYSGLRDAVAQVEAVCEEDRIRLQELNSEEEALLRKRDGALAKIEEAQASGKEEEEKQHRAAFARFDTRVQEIERAQAELEQRIQENGDNLAGYLRDLTKLQAEIKKLPAEKARSIADFVSARKIIELNDRLQGLKTSIDSGPIDAVRKANKELTAKARVTRKLAGTDVEAQDDAYEAAGATSTAEDRLSQMLAARKAERAARTGAAPKPATEKEARPEI